MISRTRPELMSNAMRRAWPLLKKFFRLDRVYSKTAEAIIRHIERER